MPDWEDVNRQFGTTYPNILALMDLILTMAPSSAEAERGFSQLKLVKTNTRSSMGQNTLNNCLAVRLLSPTIKEYDLLPAINHWNSEAHLQRRPLRRQTVKINVNETESHADAVNDVENNEESVVVDVNEGATASELNEESESVEAAESDLDVTDESSEEDVDEDEVNDRLMEIERER